MEPQAAPQGTIQPAIATDSSSNAEPQLIFKDASVQILGEQTVLQVADRRPAGSRNQATAPEAEEAPPIEVHTQAKGTSADKVKKTTTDEIPWKQLSEKNRQRVQSVISETSYYRRMPTLVIAIDPEVYQYFTTHPDAAVSIWRAMGISEMQLWQTGPEEFEGDAGDGTIGIIDVLHRGVDQKLLLCEGSFQSPILRKPIKARSLLMLTSSLMQETDGTYYVTHRADLFVSFPSQTIETAAKILSPVTGPMVDRTFTEMSLFLRMMSLAMAKRPGWVEQISTRMDGVQETRKLQLLQVAAQVHNRERQKSGLAPITVEKLPTGTPPPAAAERISSKPAVKRQ